MSNTETRPASCIFNHLIFCSHHQLLIYRCFVMCHFSFIQTCPLVLMADTLSPIILHSTLALSRFAKYDVRRHLFKSSEKKVGDFALQVHQILVHLCLTTKGVPQTRRYRP